MADAWALFGDAAPAAAAPPVAEGQGEAQAHVQAFVAANLGRACADLRRELPVEAHGMAADLQVAFGALGSGRYGECRKRSVPVAAQLWRMHQAGGWPHVCLRELFLMALVMAGTAEVFLLVAGDVAVTQIGSWQEELGLEVAGGKEGEEEVREGGGQREAAAASIIQRLDLALILGAHGPLIRPLVAMAEAEVARCLSSPASGVTVPHSPSLCREWPVTRPLKRLEGEQLPSVAQFDQEYFKGDQPVILHGVMARDGWAALAEWRRLAYWLQVLGHRLLPVEVGCMAEQLEEQAREEQTWREELLAGRQFVERFMMASTLRSEEKGEGDFEVGYVAQHPLCEQVEVLKEAFTVPAYCQLGTQEAKNVNVWMGTHGTVTALHYDSYDNILAQVVGRKYVRLYSPKESGKLYALQVANEDRRGIASQRNVSAVHVGKPDATRFPLFAEAEYVDMVLGPDDMLFIPAGWWHYVEALSPSVSVNFWF